MKTVTDLGRLIKRKYPRIYDKLSDEEVGRLVKKRYPEYSDYLDTDIQAVIDYYSPERGKLTSWWQRGKAEGRGKLLEALNLEQRLVIEQGAILESSVLSGEKAASDHQVFLAKNHHTLLELKHLQVLIQEAAAQGFSLDTDQEIKKHKALTDIDIENRWKEIVQDLNASDLVTMSDHQLLQKERQYLAEEVRAKFELLAGNDPQEVKDELALDMDQHIEFLKERIHARQTRLLLSENGNETLRLEEGTAHSPGRDTEEIKTAQE
jgi:hypothetical protein